MKRASTSLLLSVIVAAGSRAAAQTVPLESVIVSATRASDAPDQIPFTVYPLSGDALRTAPTLTLDSALRSVPGFSLFRRSDSLTANPTAQGVSLRGLGPSGASRTLVLLDGVPLNDPFGGWVAWTKVPRESLARAEVVPGGGATAWGNAALGGVIQLFTEKPATAGGRVAATIGDYQTRGVEAEVAQPIGNGVLQLSGRDFQTEGFHTVAPERIGPIDTPAGDKHRWISGTWREPVGENAELTITGRGYWEWRANGTPYQKNSTREAFGAATLAAHPSESFHWNATAYLQNQSFTSTFSSVNATRTAETPASIQYGVPSTATGLAWSGDWKQADGGRVSLGVDARNVRGETREYMTFVGNAYTRGRLAGGEQGIVGAFGEYERPLIENFHASIGARVDYWREKEGHRQEYDLATGASLRNDLFSPIDGVEFSPSAGVVWKTSDLLRLRISAQNSFRRPTLNELYRPFRVGSVLTEPNPNLKTERVTSVEVGADLTLGALKVGAVLFWNNLRDAVANVTVAHGPANVPGFGVIPAGGSGRRRLNLDSVFVQGVELTAEWRVAPALAVTAGYLFDDTDVRHASVNPALEGLQLAEVPRQSGSIGAVWNAPWRLTIAPRVRWISRQFEDDENQLPLASAVVGDLSVDRAFDGNWDVFVTVENVGNVRIQTGRSADGIVNTGTPRLATFGVRKKW